MEILEILDEKEELMVNYLMAQEFLESRLGIQPTKWNILRFIHHMRKFEKEVEERSVKKSH